MDFPPCPFSKHLTSNCGFVFAEGRRLGVESYIDGLSDPKAEVFQGNTHGLSGVLLAMDLAATAAIVLNPRGKGLQALKAEVLELAAHELVEPRVGNAEFFGELQLRSRM
jgi:hypothetical protein